MKKTLFILLILYFSCSHRPKMPAVHIGLVNDGHAVEFTGIDPAIMGEIQRDSIQGIWENLIPVYRMPADTDLKDFQPVQHGRYQEKNNAVIFTPDTPFVKGRAYFMRFFRFNGGINAWDLIREKKKPGSVGHIDLAF